MKRRAFAALRRHRRLAVPAAHADGDPASDYLLTQNTFFPFDAKVSKEQAEVLNHAHRGCEGEGLHDAGRR